LFVTEGILPRMMMSNGDLRGVSAVVFDEFHERSLTCDIGLAAVRALREDRRRDLGLVVMSATLAAAPVQAFLGGCSHVHAEGRMYPVETSCIRTSGRERCWDLAASALQDLVVAEPEGDVLVFMPGVYEIRRTIDAFRRVKSPMPLTVLPLYGDMPADRQHDVMEPAAGRKIIVATNIAETSLTIPGVRHVIDSGLARINRHDPARGINVLETVAISRDSADQRAGRAGREAPGTCRRLWTLTEQHRKPASTPPEVRRVDLTEGVLQLHALGYTHPDRFHWFEAPKTEAVQAASTLLHWLGIVDRGTGLLTRLGRAVSRLPLHPRLGLLVCLGRREGCFGEAALAAAILAERPLTLRGKGTESLRKRAETRSRRGGPPGTDTDMPQSDLLVQMDALQTAAKSRFSRDVCAGLGIHGGAARQVHRAWQHLLARDRDARRGGARRRTAAAAPEALLTCLLRAFPDRLARRRDAGSLVCDMAGGRRAELARESVARDETLLVAGEIREIGGRGGQSGKTLLSLVSGVREDWLWEYFPDDWEEVDETVWDERRKQAFRHRRLSCLGVVLEETVSPDADPVEAARMLAERVRDGKLRLQGWDRDVDAWIERVRWVAAQFPERELTTYDDEDLAVIRQEICAGATSYRQVKNKPCLDHVRHAMNWDDIQFVEGMAPTVLQLPSGRRMKIAYQQGQTPKGRATIQDLYGLETTPSVAGGRCKLLLEILAPNMRTVQITDDLGRFWKDIYPRAKSELARRYHKHEWR
jgi:ATP-dependent helicase HrpB